MVTGGVHSKNMQKSNVAFMEIHRNPKNMTFLAEKICVPLLPYQRTTGNKGSHPVCAAVAKLLVSRSRFSKVNGWVM